METTEMFIGGVAIMFIATLLTSLLAINKKIGFIGAWVIGMSFGLFISFTISTGIGLFVGVAGSLISALVSDKKGGKSPAQGVSVELQKLDNLRQRGVISESEFRAQKEKLLRRN